ncbi:TIL domain-containing protein [Caenorhabditis elegans]|uniref:TIL domain-containing protein n=1 Tax=Caenorhabditis elegans TaxID=6239 RepID=Q94162_CAEEL|nr:TIL domain-containing protein [Caenorhabditis elegans]CCD64159.1 TIL domain-containing protein [Caenorhabditis elegans]|eukprot:NP_504416.1 Uncharacterized protein CELE_C10G8.4 [Caenorhabditis elegans]
MLPISTVLFHSEIFVKMKFLIILLVAIVTITAAQGRYQRCPSNEEFRSCGTACEPTCQNPNPQVCTLQCILNVCQCSQGFVRGPNGCVPPQDCFVYGK